MKKSTYLVEADSFWHARSVGELSRAAKSYNGTDILITKNDRTVKASQFLFLLGLSVKKGDSITITAVGPEEDEAIMTMHHLFKQTLS